MHLLALDETALGTAQVLTMVIPLGTFAVVTFVTLFTLRSGHERAHRLQLLYQRRLEQLGRRRPEVLEAIRREQVVEGPPGLPRPEEPRELPPGTPEGRLER